MINVLVDESLREIISEAKNGYINFELGKLYMKFDTVIEQSFSNVTEDNNMPILNIQKYKDLYKSLYKYIEILLTNDTKWSNSIPSNNLKEYIKKQICYLFSNATFYDFNNPNIFVNRYINFLTDDTFDDINTADNIYIEQLGATLNIRKTIQPGGQETPFALDITLERTVDGHNYQYHLPYVRYGINNIENQKDAYLYAIQNKPSDNLGDNPYQIKFNKEMKRKLYQVNKGIENQELLNVSPSFVLVYTIFLSILKKENIGKLYVAKKLPEKIYIKEQLYGNQEEKIRLMSPNKIKALGIVTDVEKLKQNLTERFVKITDRMSNHLNGMNVQDLDKESFKVVTIDYQNDYINNELLSEIYNKFSDLNTSKRI